MCNTDKIFIHAGWNKTATTFLQRNLFVAIFGESLIGPNTQLNDLQRKSPDKPLLISDESILGVTIFKRHFSLFPRQHFIYNFDLFKTNPNILIMELFSFIGINLSDLDALLGKAMHSNSENSSVGYKSASALRVVNKFVSSPLFPNKPIPKSFFRFMALGKTPRELFQSLPKEKVKRRLTQSLYDSLRDKLDLDWKAIETSYVNISNVKSNPK
ncbi:hypothetical protein [Nodularia sp. NIES-3585]|uniref:hypothetical protein n=1 Tax=Nodularia sp. NIES-3585 TaxID=1973477 RepID=UPI000B5C7AAA|nr:hypothetical protein [Nodularia sp. NIES-3585]GAX34311.1 hypothetical protein NIES3585_03110 [Nodularia sp. NIES-3585]